MTTRRVEPLALEAYRELVRESLAEDVGRGDVTTAATVDPRQQATAVLLAKTPCVLAGLDVFCEAFRQCDPAVEIVRHKCDGDACEPGTIVAELRGQAAGLLARIDGSRRRHVAAADVLRERLAHQLAIRLERQRLDTTRGHAETSPASGSSS